MNRAETLAVLRRLRCAMAAEKAAVSSHDRQAASVEAILALDALLWNEPIVGGHLRLVLNQCMADLLNLSLEYCVILAALASLDERLGPAVDTSRKGD